MDDFSLSFLHQINKFMCMKVGDYDCILNVLATQ